MLAGESVAATIDGTAYERKPDSRDASRITRRMQAAGPTEIDLHTFCERVREGRTWMGGTFEPSGSGWGRFIGQRLFALDIDNATEYQRKDGSKGKRNLLSGESGHLAKDEALDRCEGLGLAVVCLYDTFSSTDEIEKFRIVIDAGETITDEQGARDVLAWLLDEFPEADQSCKNPNRLFYGSNGNVSETWADGRLAGEPDAGVSLLDRAKEHKARKKQADRNHDEVSTQTQTQRAINRSAAGDVYDWNDTATIGEGSTVGRADERSTDSTGEGDPEIKAMNAEAPLLDLIRSDTREQGTESGKYILFHICPVCGHKDDFSYVPETNSWCCYGDSNKTGIKGGGYSDYMRATRGLNQTEAIRALREVTDHPFEPASSGEGRSHSDAGSSGGAKGDEWLRQLSEKYSDLLEDITGDNHLELPPEIVEGLFGEGELICIIAPSKAGKTFIATQLGTCIAKGGEFLGHKCAQLPVVYFNFEVGRPYYADRLDKFSEGVPEGMFRVYNLRGGKRKVDANTALRLADYEFRQLGSKGRGVVFIDSLYNVMDGSENDQDNMSPVVETFQEFIENTSHVVFLVHHEPKGLNGHKSPLDRASGSGILGRAIDGAFALDPITPSDGTEFDDDLAAGKPKRIEFQLRNRSDPAPIDVFFVNGKFIPDYEGVLSDCVLKGSPRDGGAKGGRAATRAAAERQTRERSCIVSAREECVKAKTPPTLEAMMDAYNRNAGDFGLGECGTSNTLTQIYKRTGFANKRVKGNLYCVVDCEDERHAEGEQLSLYRELFCPKDDEDRQQDGTDSP